MLKYKFLISILDEIRKEGSVQFSGKYTLNETDIEKVNQSRARAFIHLYPIVSFGIHDFEERGHFIFYLGAYDGGIDGDYIHNDPKTYIRQRNKATSFYF